MDSEVTILKLKDTIIVPIQIELHDYAARRLQENILKEIEKYGARGLVIDISAVFIIDSFLGRLLAETYKMAELMGTAVVLTGMKKEVALTLIQLGLNFKNLRTALNLDEALSIIEQEKFLKNNPNVNE